MQRAGNIRFCRDGATGLGPRNADFCGNKFTGRSLSRFLQNTFCLSSVTFDREHDAGGRRSSTLSAGSPFRQSGRAAPLSGGDFHEAVHALLNLFSQGEGEEGGTSPTCVFLAWPRPPEETRGFSQPHRQHFFRGGFGGDFRSLRISLFYLFSTNPHPPVGDDTTNAFSLYVYCSSVVTLNR